MSRSSYWLVYKDSKWSGKVPGGFSYILGPILPNLIFRPYLGGGQNSRFRGKPDRGSKFGNLILWWLESSYLWVDDKIRCFHPPEHFFYHIQSFKVYWSMFSCTFADIFWLFLCQISPNGLKWPLGPVPTPTNPAIVGQWSKIFQFCKKWVKVH